MAHSDKGQTGDSIYELIKRHQPGWTLARPFYTDQAIFELEIEKIFRRYWLYVGHISQIPRPGDYFLYDIDGESLIIIRGDNDQVYGLFNVCRHRGARICHAASDHIRNLICPYHAWVYKLDGTLQSARLMPKDFNKLQFGLHRAKVQLLEGFIFISLADDPPSFEPILREIQPHLKPHEFENAKICYTQHLNIHANWKILAENSRECYHCGPAHPELCQILILAAAVGSLKLTLKEQRLNELSLVRWQKMGLYTSRTLQTTETWYQAFRVPFSEGCVTMSLDGQPVAPLMGCFKDREVGILNTAILPTFWLEGPGDYAAIYRYVPAGPALTRLRIDWLVRADANEGIDYQVERVTEMLQIVNRQDWQVCEATQAGVSSSRYQPGPYADVEFKLDNFVQWYLRQLK